MGLLLQPATRSIRPAAEVVEGVDPGVMPVRPLEAEGVATDPIDGHRVDVGGYHLRNEDPLSGHLLDAAGAGAAEPQRTRREVRDLAVLPPDSQARRVLVGPDLVGKVRLRRKVLAQTPTSGPPTR